MNSRFSFFIAGPYLYEEAPPLFGFIAMLSYENNRFAYESSGCESGNGCSCKGLFRVGGRVTQFVSDAELRKTSRWDDHDSRIKTAEGALMGKRFA